MVEAMEAIQLEKYIAFAIGEDLYGVKIIEVKEIVKMQEITVIPNTNAYIKGVINLRGIVIPIVSLRHRLGLPEEKDTKDTRIVVVNYEGEMVGIVVDKVSRVVTFEDIQSSPDHNESPFFGGIGISGEDLVTILNLNEILRQ
ncbi:chemotaxis protein CheW [Siminovitchia sp. 179-K 8D1 HS]|uniref:chemotaxis protein CheW n=1 Tax=Siminovitchia sp. 179-K 8D1 HS TaxID=3142385 RepID=UPI0039A21D1A